MGRIRLPHQPARRRRRRAHHPKWPGYSGYGRNAFFTIHVRHYQLRTILNNTVQCFLELRDAYLLQRRVAAKRRFVAMYREDATDAPTPDVQRLHEYIECLNKFFVFGLLTSAPPERPLARLELQDRAVFHPERRGHVKGWCRPDGARGGRQYYAITVTARTGGRLPHSLAHMLTLLAHEMVHAYLRVLSCRCACCRRDRANTVGLEGHGDIFLFLYFAMQATVHAWAPELGAIGDDDETDFHGNDALAADFYRDLRVRGLQGRWAPRRRAPSARHLIRWGDGFRQVVISRQIVGRQEATMRRLDAKRRASKGVWREGAAVSLPDREGSKEASC